MSCFAVTCFSLYGSFKRHSTVRLEGIRTLRPWTWGTYPPLASQGIGQQGMHAYRPRGRSGGGSPRARMVPWPFQEGLSSARRRAAVGVRDKTASLPAQIEIIMTASIEEYYYTGFQMKGGMNLAQEKDAAERQLESYNDVFADIFNVLLFDGERVITEDALRDAQPVSQFKADGALHQEERDCAKYWMDGLLRVGLLGLENQTGIEAEEPLRVIAYDGESYKAQLIHRVEDRRAGRKPQPLYPSVTLVLNFGEKRWSGKTSLRDCLQIPEKLLPYVEDYRIRVFDIAFLEEATLRKFRSDFRLLAEYLVQKRTRTDFTPSQQEIEHVDALFKMMEAASGVRGFLERLEEQRKVGKEPKMLTGFLLENRLRDEENGRVQGRTQGIAIERARSARMFMRRMSFSEDEAMDFLEIPENERDECRKYLAEPDAP